MVDLSVTSAFAVVIPGAVATVGFRVSRPRSQNFYASHNAALSARIDRSR